MLAVEKCIVSVISVQASVVTLLILDTSLGTMHFAGG